MNARFVSDWLMRGARLDVAKDWSVSLRARPEISESFWASRRPPGEARGARIPGVCKRRATRPGRMHRRPTWQTYSHQGPKGRPCSVADGEDSGRVCHQLRAVEAGSRLTVLTLERHWRSHVSRASPR